MITYEDECVGCPPEMGCMGNSCPNRNVLRMYCDNCDDECEELYVFDGHELCADCVLDSLEKIRLFD